VKFFFDNCISRNLADAMALIARPNHHIEHLTQRFDANALDVDWIPQLAADPEIILVSADPAITTAKKEKEIWRQSGLTSFFFGGNFAQLSRWPQVAEVATWWPEIVRVANDAPWQWLLAAIEGCEERAEADLRAA
jgi:hypothetical protein